MSKRRQVHLTIRPIDVILKIDRQAKAPSLNCSPTSEESMSNPLCGKFMDKHPGLERSPDISNRIIYHDWRYELSAMELQALEERDNQRYRDESDFDGESRHLPPRGHTLWEECDY